MTLRYSAPTWVHSQRLQPGELQFKNATANCTSFRFSSIMAEKHPPIAAKKVQVMPSRNQIEPPLPPPFLFPLPPPPHLPIPSLPNSHFSFPGSPSAGSFAPLTLIWPTGRKFGYIT
jgi:hypothetical protein